MSRLVAGLAAAVLALGAATASALPATAATPERVTVKGHVRSDEGVGIPGVLVSVYTVRNGHRVFVRQRTSATGRYAVSVLDSDWEYGLKVVDHGDADADDGDGRWAPSLQKRTAKHVTSLTWDAVLQPGARLAGRILDRSGKPPKAGLEVGAAVGKLGSTTRTRADGTYRFANLPAGQARVSAASPGGWGRTRIYSASTPKGVTQDSDATTVPVAPGSPATGIDIAFPKVGKITGRVVVDGDEPSSEGADGVYAVLVDADGQEVARYWSHPAFRMWDIEPGTYTLRFESGSEVTDPIVPEYYKDSPTAWGAKRLVVKSGTAITGLVAHLQTD